jgi:hypothetical protein
MATAADQKKTVADWVKWAVVLSYAVLTGIIVHEVNGEHRLTKVETDQTAHERTAGEQKREIYRRLDKQDDNQSQLLKIMSDVQASVAAIKGYMEGAKNAKQQ